MHAYTIRITCMAALMALTAAFARADDDSANDVIAILGPPGPHRIQLFFLGLICHKTTFSFQPQ